MAADTHDTNPDLPTGELKVHVRNYEGFIRIAKIAAIVCFVIAISVMLIIAR